MFRPRFLRHSFLLLFTLCCGTTLFAKDPLLPLAQLKKETVYVLASEQFKTADLVRIFGKNVQRLDTAAHVINLNVHRIGLAFVSQRLPFRAADFPNVQQLMIYAQQRVPVDVTSLENLQSLMIGDTCFTGNTVLVTDSITSRLRAAAHETIGNDFLPEQIQIEPGLPQIDFDAPLLLAALPNLEEFELSIPPAYLPEQLGAQKNLQQVDALSELTPLFFYRKEEKTIPPDYLRTAHPYPELAALVAMGFNKGNLDDLSRWNFGASSMDSVLHWIPGTKLQPKKTSVPLPLNGEWSLLYANGQKICTVTMADGLPDGDVRFWYYDGALCELRHYSKGVETGSWTCNNEDGTTNRTFEFANGKLQSLTVSLENYPHSTDSTYFLRRTEFWFFPERHALTITGKSYGLKYPFSQMYGNQTYWFENGVKQRGEETYIENGQLLQYTVDSASVHAVTSWNKYGKLIEYSRRTGNDSVFTWHIDNGRLTCSTATLGEYKRTTWWNDDGTRPESERKERATQSISQGTYHSNGTLKTRYQYSKEGVIEYTISYYDNGLKQEEQFYNKYGGIQELFQYDHNGKLEAHWRTVYGNMKKVRFKKEQRVTQ